MRLFVFVLGLGMKCPLPNPICTDIEIKLKSSYTSPPLTVYCRRENAKKHKSIILEILEKASQIFENNSGGYHAN